jgi:hypothetical protein
MYYIYNLKEKLQEWMSRLERADFRHFGNQLEFLITNIEKERVTNNIINEACVKYHYDDLKIENMLNNRNFGSYSYESQEEEATCSYKLIKYLFSRNEPDQILYVEVLPRGDQDKKTVFIKNFVYPILYYLDDRLDKSNSTIYLLEKYKRRTEWFTKRKLFEQYDTAKKNYEQIFEDDLRLFLLDQGVDYPFSTPMSSSGRADIVGEIDTENPLVVEIKIFDRAKGYGKDRIIDGFTQIYRYTNEYNKDVGYLIIFNMDKAELKMNFTETEKTFPPAIYFNNKVFYFVVINTANQCSASEAGIIRVIEITENELIKAITTTNK